MISLLWYHIYRLIANSKQNWVEVYTTNAPRKLIRELLLTPPFDFDWASAVQQIITVLLKRSSAVTNRSRDKALFSDCHVIFFFNLAWRTWQIVVGKKTKWIHELRLRNVVPCLLRSRHAVDYRGSKRWVSERPQDICLLLFLSACFSLPSSEWWVPSWENSSGIFWRNIKTVSAGKFCSIAFIWMVIR